MEFNSKKVFVGNLPFSATKNDLETLFNQFGRLVGVNIREDRTTGKPKGFGFVTFESDEAATQAISTMNNYSYAGRTLTVNKASIRGSDANGNDREQIDDSWKTVPTPAPSMRSKTDSKNNQTKTQNKKPKATWDQWASPVQKQTNAVGSISKK